MVIALHAQSGYANHSEVSVPKIYVKIPNTVSDENAVYSTLRRIVVHGIRTGKPTNRSLF